MDKDLETVSYDVYKDGEHIASNEILVSLILMVTDTFNLQKNTDYSVKFYNDAVKMNVSLNNYEL
jgi:hypothetical protein